MLIARAVYSDSDIYLVDDCLSALDAYVGQRIFEDVLCGSLKSKTRVMATHHLNKLSDSSIDRILLFKDGLIVADGTYEEISQHPDF